MLSRQEALKILVEEYPSEPIVVNVGATVRELVALVGKRPEHLYVLDSMGLPPAIGLGISLALAGTDVAKCVTLEGDGGMLMGLSTLATIGHLKPSKLLLIVLDNGCYASTGSQATSAASIDFAAVARGCGIAAFRVSDGAGLHGALREARNMVEPVLLHVPIDQTNLKVPFVLEDPAILADRFRGYLGQTTAKTT